MMQHFAKHPRLKNLAICCWCGQQFFDLSDHTRDQKSRHRNGCVSVCFLGLCVFVDLIVAQCVLKDLHTVEKHAATTANLDILWRDLQLPQTEHTVGLKRVCQSSPDMSLLSSPASCSSQRNCHYKSCTHASFETDDLDDWESLPLPFTDTALRSSPLFSAGTDFE